MAQLDNFEGFPYYYDRKQVDVIYKDAIVTAFVYFMQPGNKENMPDDTYFSMCLAGYLENYISPDQLHFAKKLIQKV